MTFKKWLYNNSLTVVMFSIFAVTLIGMSVVGWQVANDELRNHHQPSESYAEYLVSGDFVEAVFENWESEFLQMWALVMLTIFLRQKGSTDSKKLVNADNPQDTSSRYSIIRATTWSQKKRAVLHGLYSHSLGLALLGLFLLSFILHAAGGASAYNEEALQHGEQAVSVIQYLGTSQFWFESLQNWQSEFLAVGALIVLSIYLRERGSQQSKPVGKSYDSTTGE
jgi:hypothetical protein